MKKLLLLYCLLLYSFYTDASLGNFNFLTTKDGLNNNTVYDIYSEKNGFIWFSTDRGISRYDGFRFRNFPLISPADSLLRPSSCAVKQIMEGTGRRLYLLLSRGGIACFDRQKEQYLPLLFDQPLDNKSILSFYITDKDILYIGTTNGLYTGKMMPTREKGVEKVICYLSQIPLVKGQILKICGDGKGNLFAGINANKVFHYNTISRKGEYIGPKAEDGANMTALYVHGNYLWICHARQGISYYHLKRKTLHSLNAAEGVNQALLSGTSVTDIDCVDEQTFYLSTWTGLCRMKFSSKELENATCTMDYIPQKKSAYYFEAVNETTNVLWDASQKIVWAGTFGGGALKIDLNGDNYSHVDLNIGARVNGIEEDRQGYVWLATNKGIWRSTANTLSVATTFKPWTKEVSTHASYQIYQDRNGNLWLGNMQGGITFVNPTTEETRSWQINRKGTTSAPPNIRHFCLDIRNNLWAITSDGLILLDHKAETQYQSVPILNPEVREVYAITEDKEGNVWIGTNVGLKRMEMQGEKVNLIGAYEQQAKLEVGPVYSIYVNSYNQIFASYSDKVIRIDGREKEKVETTFSLTNGLDSGHIYCMVDDQNGNTWVGSNSDIMTIRNDRPALYNYSLSGNYNHVCRLKDGRLLWSSSWGLFFFDPVAIKSTLFKNKLLISELYVNGKSISVGQVMNSQLLLSSVPNLQDQFMFNADNNDFCFYFTDLQYSLLQRKITYRLLPEEKEWKTTTLGSGIDYRRLSAGEYTLQVKLVYLDASEGEMLEIPIQVKTHWWQTIWAYLGYLTVIAAMSGLIAVCMNRREKSRDIQRLWEARLKNKLNLDKMELDKRQEIESIRNQLLTTVVQELRTPLSLIIAPLKEMSQEDSLPPRLLSKVQMAYRNAVRMLDSCNQLFDIYTQGTLTDKLKVAPFDADKILNSIVFNLSELIRIHQIDFHYEKKVKKEMEIWVDKKRINFVLHNILSNALNHIRFSGTVNLSLQETLEEGRRYCTISVIDSGKETIRELGQMLDENEQVDLSKIELGFDVMRRIVVQHHGTIQMESGESRNTRVVVSLPLEKEILEEDPTIEFVQPEQLEEVVLPPQEVALPEILHVLEETIPLILPSGEAEPTPRSKKVVLVVEDHKDIRLYLKVLLSKSYEILFATNGQEGVDMATKEQPDLVLCDVMMPVMDGFECCRVIKESLDTCHIPFIMLTAKVEDEDIIKGLELGADDYMLKPFTPGILKAKIKNLIHGRVNLKQMYTKLLMLPEANQNNESTEKEEDPKVENPFIASVIQVIEENIREADFNVKKLATDMNMSQPTLYRKVKQSTDFTIIELIRGVRMRKAAQLLKLKQYAVQEVVEMVGYNDIPTFRKHFVDTFGTTPSTYADSTTQEKN